jgi:hypothetical protein
MGHVIWLDGTPKTYQAGAPCGALRPTIWAARARPGVALHADESGVAWKP